jgi:hypothetical protein
LLTVILLWATESNWVAESGATARTSLGLGSIATQDANSVTITGGTISGTTVNTFTVGSNAVGTRHIRNIPPTSGSGSDGDVWYEY